MKYNLFFFAYFCVSGGHGALSPPPIATASEALNTVCYSQPIKTVYNVVLLL